MALHEDFSMYYSSTYVGYRTDDGIVKPFYIDHVQTDRRVFDYTEATEKEIFSDHALDALRFVGMIDNNAFTIKYNDPNLILEMPDSKYIQLNGRYYWVSWRANRSTKKGLNNRRLTGINQFGSSVAAAMFDERPVEGVIGGCMVRIGDDLYYKGVIIGEWVGENQIDLNPEASHLSRFINQEIPGCLIQIQEN